MPILSYITGGLLKPIEDAGQHVGNANMPIELPKASDLIEAWRKGWIGDRTAAVALQLNQVSFASPLPLPNLLPQVQADSLNALWHQMALSKQTVPGDDEAIQYYLRHPDQIEVLKTNLQQNGWQDPNYTAQLVELANIIPGSGQLIQYVSAGLFSPQFVQDWGLNDGYPDYIETWQRSNGTVWDTGLTGYAQVTPGPVSFARMDWWGHWQLPGVSQLEDMRHRLRTRIDNPAEARDPSGLVFTDEQINALYGPNNIPPGFVLASQAMSYKPASIRVVQGMAQDQTVPRSEVTEILLDQGYSRYTADILTEYYWNKPSVTRLQALQKEVFNDIISAYSLGLYSANDAAVLLESASLPNAASIAAFNAMAQPEQLLQALADPEVMTALRHADSKIATEHATKLIKNVQVRFQKYSFDSADSRKALMGIGLTLDAANRHIDEWMEQATTHSKTLETGELLKMYSEGLLSVAQVTARLINIGWTTPDIRILIAERQLEVNIAAAKAAASFAKTNAEKQAAQARLVAAQKKAADKAAAKLIKSAGTSDLEKYYERGVISVDQFNRGMVALGWSPTDIDNARNYIDGIVADKPKKQPKAVKPTGGAKGTKIKKAAAAAILSWWGKGILVGDEVAARLSDLGYGSADIKDMMDFEATKAGFIGIPQT